MELFEAIGSRRSFRYLNPHKPVELEKIQKMLEAARLASFWGNVQALKAVVVHKETAPQEVVESLVGTVQAWQLKQAPVIIVWYLDDEMLDKQGDRLHEINDARATGTDYEESKKQLDEFLIPFFKNLMDYMRQTAITEFDCGQGVAQATLVAVQEGLGCCCVMGPNEAGIKAATGLGERAKVLTMQCVGYPAEDWEAGGQRPRLPLGERFFLNTMDTPFPRSEEVVQELKEKKMLQRPAPLPWRQTELEYLKHALKLPDDV